MTLPYTKKNSHFVLYSMNEKGEKLNVIEFYNQFFLIKMKPYLKNLKESSQSLKNQIFATPRPIFHSLITNSPLKQFTSNQNIQAFQSPFRRAMNEPNMTPFSASLYVKDEQINKVFRTDFENTSKRLDLSRNFCENKEKPNNSLLNRIKNKYEGHQQPTLLLKSNSKILSEGENSMNLSRGLSRSLFGEGMRIEEIEESPVKENGK